MPDEAEVLGLLALMLLTDARRPARVSGEGSLILLEDQDRSRWNQAAIEEGRATLERALRMGRGGTYQVQAAIAAVHADAGSFEATDWRQIALLYNELSRLAPSPVVELNRAVAVAMADGPTAGLSMIEAIRGDGQLESYHLMHAARADLLRRLGRMDEAALAYRRAVELVGNAAERRYLEGRLREARAALS